jgi:hypothetical protein
MAAAVWKTTGPSCVMTRDTDTAVAELCRTVPLDKPLRTINSSAARYSTVFIPLVTRGTVPWLRLQCATCGSLHATHLPLQRL